MGQELQELGSAPGLATAGYVANTDPSVWPNAWRQTHPPCKDVDTMEVGIQDPGSSQGIEHSRNVLADCGLSMGRRLI